MARALMLVASNLTDPGRAGEFHDWYAQHVQELLQVEGIMSATRWELSPHQVVPVGDALGGRSYLALYEIECDDVKTVRDRILATSAERSHSDTLEMDPLPVSILFEHLGEWT